VDYISPRAIADSTQAQETQDGGLSGAALKQALESIERSIADIKADHTRPPSSISDQIHHTFADHVRILMDTHLQPILHSLRSQEMEGGGISALKHALESIEKNIVDLKTYLKDISVEMQPSRIARDSSDSETTPIHRGPVRRRKPGNKSVNRKMFDVCTFTVFISRCTHFFLEYISHMVKTKKYSPRDRRPTSTSGGCRRSGIL
jgi:hypothetical protein